MQFPRPQHNQRRRYVYRVGIASTVPNYSYAAAIGLFKSAVGLILVLAVDRFAKRLGQRGAL